jgi:hypothetical protein
MTSSKLIPFMRPILKRSIACKTAELNTDGIICTSEMTGKYKLIIRPLRPPGGRGFGSVLAGDHGAAMPVLRLAPLLPLVLASVVNVRLGDHGPVQIISPASVPTNPGEVVGAPPLAQFMLDAAELVDDSKSVLDLGSFGAGGCIAGVLAALEGAKVVFGVPHDDDVMVNAMAETLQVNRLTGKKQTSVRRLFYADNSTFLKEARDIILVPDLPVSIRLSCIIEAHAAKHTGVFMSFTRR